VSTASKSPSRLRPWKRCLSRCCSMVTRPSSPERQRSSLARKSTVARRATRTNDTRVANGGHECTAGEHECVADGSSTLPRQFTYPPPRGSVLIATTMSWSMSWCHCSTADCEACELGGLWRSWHATSSVPSRPAPSGVTPAVAAECYRYAVAIVPTAMLAPWVFVRRNRPTLERELASCSIPC
jgi:hypothetical protein